MARIDIFEWEDLPWFPHTLRNYMTDFLQFIITRLNVYRTIVPDIQEVLEKQKCDRIIDLCSGSSGPIEKICSTLQKSCLAQVVLTDKFPSLETWQAICQKNPLIQCVSTPVDAISVPENLSGLRTIFSGFHHFRPEAARKILQDAVAKKQPIAIFEITGRTPWSILQMLLMPLFLILFTPFIRPFRPGRLFWTYLIPLVPALILWDGLASCLRSYNLSEFKKLTENLSEDYIWQIGKKWDIWLLLSVKYMIGYADTNA